MHRDLCYHGQCRRRTAGTVYSSAEDFELDYARSSSLERREIMSFRHDATHTAMLQVIISGGLCISSRGSMHII